MPLLKYLYNYEGIFVFKNVNANNSQDTKLMYYVKHIRRMKVA